MGIKCKYGVRPEAVDQAASTPGPEPVFSPGQTASRLSDPVLEDISW